jgi:feruloyl esterase
LACDLAAVQAVAPPATTIVKVDKLATPVPHCRVDGYVTTTNPGPNQVNFRLQLPDRQLWKGRYYFIGLGGSAGYVPTEYGNGNPMLGGFAVAGTDTGRQGSSQDFSFMTDPVKALDHTHRGAHVTTVAAQQITKAYYGVNKIFRYHTGCSGGGRMGAEAVERYPTDYDGVLIGNGGAQDNASFRDGNGFAQMTVESNREPGAWLSPAKLRFIDNKVTAACDATDGALDDLVWDRKLCHFNFNSVKCKGGDVPTCLTQPEITTVVNLLKDPRRPITNMSGWTQYLGIVPPPWSPEQTPENLRKTSAAYITMTSWARTFLDDPNRDIVKHPLTEAEKDRIQAGQMKTGYATPHDPQMFDAERLGTKVVMYHGVSDPVISSYLVERGYRAKAEARHNDLERVRKFARIYFAPGMVHCSGGTGPDDHTDRLLQALMDWVEKGKTPDAVVTHRGYDRLQRLFPRSTDVPTRPAMITPGAGANTTDAPNSPTVANTAPPLKSRDIVLCPYPEVAVFNRAKARVPGAIYESANWSCRRVPGRST